MTPDKLQYDDKSYMISTQATITLIPKPDKDITEKIFTG